MDAAEQLVFFKLATLCRALLAVLKSASEYDWNLKVQGHASDNPLANRLG
jgi:hypothetical protein